MNFRILLLEDETVDAERLSHAISNLERDVDISVCHSRSDFVHKLGAIEGIDSYIGDCVGDQGVSKEDAMELNLSNVRNFDPNTFRVMRSHQSDLDIFLETGLAHYNMEKLKAGSYEEQARFALQATVKGAIQHRERDDEYRNGKLLADCEIDTYKNRLWLFFLNAKGSTEAAEAQKIAMLASKAWEIKPYQNRDYINLSPFQQFEQLVKWADLESQMNTDQAAHLHLKKPEKFDKLKGTLWRLLRGCGHELWWFPAVVRYNFPRTSTLFTD